MAELFGSDYSPERRQELLLNIDDIISKGGYWAGQPDCHGTLLHWVCGWGDVPLVRQLLDNGAPIDCKDSDGCTPIQWACY